eukprot:TRINITY_DN21929_c0_g1_i1.p1 TRINITY_DN21929_c0_g1~~TRINITY_DN21929_c0_g1_i1.p1  ORF type:complete len:729 (-),score=38.19 TRINITY_DN21929_c0_g1_i1:590-2776(-)
MATQTPTNPDSFEMDHGYEGEVQEPSQLMNIWGMVVAHRIVIALIILSCLAIGVAWTITRTPLYTGTARIEIERNIANITNVQSVDREEMNVGFEFYETQYELLASQSLAERVVKSEGLANSNELQNIFDQDAEGAATNQSSADARQSRQARTTRAVRILRDGIRISPVIGSRLVDVSFVSPSPEFSARIANAWVEQFIQASLDRRFNSNNSARDYLQNQLNELRQKLEESERRLIGYSANKQIISITPTSSDGESTGGTKTLVSVDLEALNTFLAEATANRIDAKSKLALGSTDNSSLTQLRAELATLEAEYAKLASQFKSDYPRVQALEAQLAALRQNIGQEERRGLEQSRRAYQSALQREQDLQQRVNQLKSDFLEENRDGIQFNIYQREVDTNRAIYDALLQRYKEIGAAGVAASNISIVDRAEPPTTRTSPSLRSNTLMALFIGTIMSALYVFVVQQIGHGIRDPAEFKKYLNMPLFGVIPKQDGEELEVLAQLDDAKSELSESYMSVRTSLAFASDHGLPKSIVVTSAVPAEAKSISAVALAKVIGRTGKRTLLIDADIRSPSLTSYLGVESAKGLSNYLTGDNDVDHLIATLESDKLSFMASGPTPPNSAELFASDRMAALVRAMTEKFDHVIIDAPPVLGLADAPLLAAVTEGVVFVVKANNLKTTSIQAAIGRLQSSQIRLLGGILTQVELKNSIYGYGYSQGYGYGQSNIADSQSADR